MLYAGAARLIEAPSKFPFSVFGAEEKIMRSGITILCTKCHDAACNVDHASETSAAVQERGGIKDAVKSRLSHEHIEYAN